MRVVVDALPVRGDNSLRIVCEHLLSGWEQLEGDDEIHVVVRSGASLAVPRSVTVHEVDLRHLSFVGRVSAQSVTVPRLCRAVRADAMLGVLPATTMTPLPCPRAVLAWDFRYRLRPQQFARRTLLLRRASYAVGFRQADAVACISGRTRDDFLSLHSRAAAIPVHVAHLGADHVDAWPHPGAATEPYALAFGQFANKNIDLVLRAWAVRRVRRGPALPLRVVGVPEQERPRVERLVAELDLNELVTVQRWLPTRELEREFASSSLVVFPSDFEGFGLPAVEAMRLGIPVVISSDRALLEVTGGHAVVVEGEGPGALADAIDAARRSTPEALAAACRHATGFTWSRFAAAVRAALADTVRDPGARRTPVASLPAAR